MMCYAFFWLGRWPIWPALVMFSRPVLFRPFVTLSQLPRLKYTYSSSPYVNLQASIGKQQQQDLERGEEGLPVRRGETDGGGHGGRGCQGCGRARRRSLAGIKSWYLY